MRCLLAFLFACQGPAQPEINHPDHRPDRPPAQGPVTTIDLGTMAEVALVATPPGATFEDSITVALSVVAPVGQDPQDIAIWYTLDGQAPQIDNAIAYTGPITLSDSTQIRAITEIDGVPFGVAPNFVKLEADLVGWSSDVPVLVLWSGGDAPVDKTEDYTNFALSVYEPDASGRITMPASAILSMRSGLKVRGSSSAGSPKKPYRIELWHPTLSVDIDQKASLLGMPEESDWILLAPLTFDRALMRNALIYELSNTIGRYAPKTRFVELFVTDRERSLSADDYVGVYVLMERIERDDNRVPLTPLTASDLSLPELSGGYLFKEDRPGPSESGFYAGTAGGAFSFQQPFVSVYPSESESAPEQAAYLSDLLDELAEAIDNTPNFTHPVTGRHYRDIIDVDSFIDNHILNVYTKNPDAFRLSGYFNKDRNNPIQAGPIWDFDRTMGCIEDTRAEDPTWWDNSNVTVDCTFVFDHGFWRGLFHDPDFTTPYWERWRVLLANELSTPVVHGIIDDMAAELAESAPRNFATWTSYPPRGGDHASEVDLLKDWVAARHAWMTDCLTLPDPQLCVGS